MSTSRVAITRVLLIGILALAGLGGCGVVQAPPAGEDVESPSDAEDSAPQAPGEDVQSGDSAMYSPADAEDTATYLPATPLTSVADVVARVKPSVVAINTETTVYGVSRRSRTQESAGSGWIISEDGYIVTNTHVVGGAETVTVTLDDGRTFEAQEVHADTLTDIAVIKIGRSLILPSYSMASRRSSPSRR